jgi:hypothetical protein
MTFLDLFHDAANRAIMQGLTPQYIYMGPDVEPVFADYAADICWYAHSEQPPTKEERVKAILNSDNLGIFHGMQILRMSHNGIAVTAK